MKTEEQTTSAHTPGPWVAGGIGQVFDIYGNEIVICKSFGAGIVPAGYVAPWHSFEANARLIAAAPEMLATLRDCEQSLSKLPDTDGAYRVTVLTMVRGVLAKAEGTQ